MSDDVNMSSSSQSSQPPPSPTEHKTPSSSNSSLILVQSASQVASETSNEPSFMLNNIAEKAPQADKSQNSSATEEGRPSQAEPRHCWICLQDEGVDSPETSEWRSPCPCNLQAHEECLLEWITDLESPASGGHANSKIYCPQCKAEIKIERPIELIVAITDLITSVGRQFLFPAGASVLIGCLYSGSLVYGLNTLQLVFGTEEAQRLLYEGRRMRIYKNIVPDAWVSWSIKTLQITNPFLPSASNGGWLFGSLPLIAPALILSRTRIADRTFSILPIIYLLFPQNHQIPSWPPSPGFALASLPYIRSAYIELYRSVFGELEKQWNQAAQRKPREGETAEDVAHAQADRQNEGNGILDIELEIINIQEEDDEEDNEVRDQQARNERNQLPPNPNNVAVPPDQPEPAADALQPGQGVQQPNDQRPAAANEQPWEFRQNISTAQIARTMIGALFFPAASSLMGDFLMHTLPRQWVTKPLGKASTGLLQEKWGRSIVGGCLFVVLKDALTLYCKWRKATNQERRRIIDYVKPKNARNGITS